MTFKELVGTIKTIPLDEIRKEDEGYFEFVLGVQYIFNLYAFMEKFFGPPFKPPGVRPSREADDYTKNYGGILMQQTLYYAEQEGFSSCGMVWPWGNGIYFTVKLARGRLEGSR